MIKKELKGKLEEFSTTDMGHLCIKYDREPKTYRKFYFVWAIICFRARIGIIYGWDGKDSRSTQNSNGFAEKEIGITPEDILEYNNRLRLPYLDLRNYEITPEELKDHFGLLEKCGILEKVGIPGTQRDVLNQNYTSFMLCILIPYPLIILLPVSL
ncbi:MAG: hypothetical protein L0H55_10850, partial [Candidatus Nitrosocosmicus sp.]|nr:hypothetical protein [Candidatus Nitrosocosmicus sp.]